MDTAAENHLKTLIREACEISRHHIANNLSAAGFNDISPTGPLVLATLALDNEAEASPVRMLGIDQSEVSQTITQLRQRGYLEFKIKPGAPDGKSIITVRGHALLDATANAVRAARWADFPIRQGDIVVSTWPKTGTTWVQAICALLVFGTPELPVPLAELSPWLDLSRTPRDEAYAQLAAQEHRRIIKTHLSLSDIPVDPRAFYVVIGRHPLDTALSLFHQNNNKPSAVHDATPQADAGGRERPRAMPPRESLLHWIDIQPSPRVRYHYLAEMLRHLSAAWEKRENPNVTLVHYDDLSADLEGEMRRIAARLGITVPEATWPDLVKAATFEHMRAKPDQFLTSGVDIKNSADFFRKGTSGEGPALLTRSELARYHARATSLASADLLTWLHHDKTSPPPSTP